VIEEEKRLKKCKTLLINKIFDCQSFNPNKTNSKPRLKICNRKKNWKLTQVKLL